MKFCVWQKREYEKLGGRTEQGYPSLTEKRTLYLVGQAAKVVLKFVAVLLVNSGGGKGWE